MKSLDQYEITYVVGSGSCYCHNYGKILWSPHFEVECRYYCCLRLQALGWTFYYNKPDLAGSRLGNCRDYDTKKLIQ